MLHWAGVKATRYQYLLNSKSHSFPPYQALMLYNSSQLLLPIAQLSNISTIMMKWGKQWRKVEGSIFGHAFTASIPDPSPTKISLKSLNNIGLPTHAVHLPDTCTGKNSKIKFQIQHLGTLFMALIPRSRLSKQISTHPSPHMLALLAVLPNIPTILMHWRQRKTDLKYYSSWLRFH